MTGRQMDQGDGGDGKGCRWWLQYRPKQTTRCQARGKEEEGTHRLIKVVRLFMPWPELPSCSDMFKH